MDGVTKVFDLFKKDHSTVIVICICACSLQIIYGATVGYAAFIGNINNEHGYFYITDIEKAWISSIVQLGFIVGSLWTGFLLQKLGRQPLLLIACLHYAVGNLIIASSINFYIMYIGRFIAGMAQGLSQGPLNIYISEISPANIRGRLLELSGVFVTFGIVCAYIMGANVKWNWIAVINVGLSLLSSVAICTIPESPRWLLFKFKTSQAKWSRDEAIIVLQQLRKNVDISDELQEIEETLEIFNQSSSWRRLLGKRNLYYLMCCVFILFILPFTGTNFVLQYLLAIFKASRSHLDSEMQTILVGMMGLVGSILTMFTIDLIGRRFVALYSMMAQAICMIALATYFYTSIKVDEKSTEVKLFWIPLLSLLIFEVLQGWCLAVGRIIVCELFSTEMRGYASAIGQTISHLSMFLASRYFINLNYAIGFYGSFWLCGACNVIGGLFYFILIPETNNKTLENLEKELYK